MATTLEETYGLTTDDALLAYRRQHLDLLPSSNRWKPFLLDHAQGVHEGRADLFRRICLVCRTQPLEPAATRGS